MKFELLDELSQETDSHTSTGILNKNIYLVYICLSFKDI